MGPARSAPGRVRGAAAKLLARPQPTLFDAPKPPPVEDAVLAAATTEEAWDALGEGPGEAARKKARVAALNLELQAIDDALARGRAAAEQVARPLPQSWLDRFGQLHTQRFRKLTERQAAWTPELDAVGVLLKAVLDEAGAIEPPESDAVNAAFDALDGAASGGDVAAAEAACLELITAAVVAKYGGEQ